MEARVLIVEDEALIGLHLEQLVTDAGHHVVGIALDPAEARDLARRHLPHFAFVDVRLKHGASGLDVVRFLREEHDAPSIIVTGNLDKRLKAAADPYRPIDFVGKPFYPTEIVQAIDVAVGRIEAATRGARRAYERRLQS